MPLTPVPETTLLDQPGEADNLTTMHEETAMEKLLLSPEEAAEMLGVGRSRVYDLMRKRELLSVRIGKSRRVPVAALQEYVKGLTESAWVA